MELLVFIQEKFKNLFSQKPVYSSFIQNLQKIKTTKICFNWRITKLITQWFIIQQ